MLPDLHSLSCGQRISTVAGRVCLSFLPFSLVSIAGASFVSPTLFCSSLDTYKIPLDSKKLVGQVSCPLSSSAGSGSPFIVMHSASPRLLVPLAIQILQNQNDDHHAASVFFSSLIFAFSFFLPNLEMGSGGQYVSQKLNIPQNFWG